MVGAPREAAVRTEGQTVAPGEGTEVVVVGAVLLHHEDHVVDVLDAGRRVDAELVAISAV